MPEKTDLTTEHIQRCLSEFGHSEPKPTSYPQDFFTSPVRPASVLIPLFQNQGEWHLLFIRRSQWEGDRHSGQVAFPGGKVDASDASALHAALREAEEEIGLAPDNVNVLGSMAEYHTISNFLVKPIVAEIDWPVDLVAEEREVDRIFSIPVNWLQQPENHTESRRTLTGYQHDIPVIHFQRYDGELLWGITAKLTLSLLSVLRLR